MPDLAQGGGQREPCSVSRPSLRGWLTLNCCPGQSEATMSVGMGTEEHDQGRKACLSSPSGPEQKCRQHGQSRAYRKESQKV